MILTPDPERALSVSKGTVQFPCACTLSAADANEGAIIPVGLGGGVFLFLQQSAGN